jgi:lipid II:glycine glycyltransferase (peptidoglycan interpeptide bridge formation enzyme)
MTLLALSRRVAPGISLTYVPMGPQVPEPLHKREDLLLHLGRAMRPLLPLKSIAVRFDLPWHREGAGEAPELLQTGGGLRKAKVEIQPASTVILDIRRSEETILSSMKSKTRYNIRLSLKKGVSVEEGGEEMLREWYRLHEETAARDRIAIRSLKYFRDLFEAVRRYGGKPPDYRILLARSQGSILGGIIVGLWGKHAWYLYGASSGTHRNLMPNYALQWRGIQIARERGCLDYDLFGIPSSDDPEHPMAGLYQFKTGFGGRILNRMGCYDVVLRTPVYRAYGAAEALRWFYFKKLKKRFGV